MYANYINYPQYESYLFEGLTDIPREIKNKVLKLLNTKEKIIKEHELKIKNKKQQLKKEGIDPNYVEKLAKKYATRTVNKLKNDTKLKQIGKNSLNETLLIESFFKSTAGSVFKQQINEMYDEFFNGTYSDRLANVTVSVLLLVIVIMINSFMFTFFSTLTGDPVTGQLLTVVLVGPIVEEIGKFVSIKFKFSLPYLIIFNYVEFKQYVQHYFSEVGLIIIPIRLLLVYMHTLWTVIQRKKYQEGHSSPFVLTGFLHMLSNSSLSYLGWFATFMSYKNLNVEKRKKAPALATA